MWGQIATGLVSQRGMKVALVCRLFGHCRQAYYQSQACLSTAAERERALLRDVREIRGEDPGIGGRKLWLMLMSVHGSGAVPGRDSFLRMLRRHHLTLPPPRPRHTTFSNHRYHKWKNLVAGFVPTAANQLWVADITYIPLRGGGACYLHLVTDAYSRKIVGWELADTLRAAATIAALAQAIAQAAAIRGSGDLSGLIHHSDRGVQYCCDAYVEKLLSHRISISMTEDYSPTDNAIAERVNGIIKTERVYRSDPFESVAHARSVIGRYISFYNHRRPHMGIGWKVPAEAHHETGPQRKAWGGGNPPPQDAQCGENDVILQDQRESQGESASRST